jgi:hypothetical protein
VGREGWIGDLLGAARETERESWEMGDESWRQVVNGELVGGL